ncbi:MAG: hypothetical protein WBD99_08335 [Thermodesulfobacteriota bacterium]
MPQTREPARPTVDDQYWFELSKKIVESGTSSRNEAAAILQTMIVFFWGIYTASATVGIALSETSYSLPIILMIASPSIVLIAAYWVAVWVQMPVQAQFDPRIPKQIKEAYIKGVNTKSRRLAAALALSLIAAILVSSALIAASVSKQATSRNFLVYHHPKDGHNIIALSGHFHADTKIILQITPSVGPVISKVYVTPQSGEL